jgi:hypothetical protein
MILRITAIADRGDQVKERVVLKASSDTDIGRFAIFRSRVENKQVTVAISDVFWFPDKTVKSGDLVVLYTKDGTSGERVLKSGSTAHFFYWSKTERMWSGSQYAPVLVHTTEWEPFME